MPSDRKSALHRACSSLLGALPAGAHGVPDEAWMEVAEIMIESLVQDRHAAKGPRVEASGRRREMEAIRVAQLLRDEGVRGRAAAAA